MRACWEPRTLSKMVKGNIFDILLHFLACCCVGDGRLGLCIYGQSLLLIQRAAHALAHSCCICDFVKFSD